MYSIIVKNSKTKNLKNPSREKRSRYRVSRLFVFLSLQPQLFSFTWFCKKKKKIICPLFLQNCRDSLCCHERDGNADDGCDAASREEPVLSGRQQDGG